MTTIIGNYFITYRGTCATLFTGFLFMFGAGTVSASPSSGNADHQEIQLLYELKGKILSQYKKGHKRHHKPNKRCTKKLEDGDSALTSVELFRKYFHAGDYCKLPILQDALMGEYLQTNRAFAQTQDPTLKIKVAKIAKIIGLAYLWANAESGRTKLGPSALNALLSASFYFNKSYELNPEDTQTLGFFANVQMALGKIHGNQELVEEGVRLIALSIETNPVFGLFGAAFGDVRAPVNSPVFQRGIERFWTYQDICMQTEVDRSNPDWAPYLPIEDGENWNCPNTENSLHRVEAFLFIFGDALLKAGDLDAARAIYNNINYISTAKNWKFKRMVKRRLRNLERDYEALQTPDPSDDPTLIFLSKYKCSVCHLQ